MTAWSSTRIIDDFLIQGGDPRSRDTGGPGYNFDDEIHPELTFTKPYASRDGQCPDRVVARALTAAQFFITTVPTTWLQGKHMIFW
jgi:peptidyl-prolyl cis-trans isomerase A (cyclophilin A)